MGTALLIGAVGIGGLFCVFIAIRSAISSAYNAGVADTKDAAANVALKAEKAGDAKLTETVNEKDVSSDLRYGSF